MIWPVLLALLPLSTSIAQPVPVRDLQDVQYRALQLLSDSTIRNSLGNRPLWRSTYREIFDHREIRRYAGSWWASPLGAAEDTVLKVIRLGAYEPVLTTTYNSKLPYGGNNGAAWYGAGLNTELQGGLYLTSPFLTLTLRPHLMYTQNNDFKTPRFIPEDGEGEPRYRAIFPAIDMPFRFGPDAYTTFNWGQTSARLHLWQLEAGLSNETLWWGPGVQNALLISNNAPGLRHAFAGTRAPIRIPLLGAVEFRWIWAWPEDSDYFDAGAPYQRDRFMSGFNVIYTPSVAPNLSLGFSRIAHEYIPLEGLQTESLTRSLPFARRQTKGSDTQNQLVSAYLRWVFPESGFEVYGEYFREDSFFDLRDLFLEPDHDRAYTLGMQKVIESEWIDFFKVNAEINNLVPNRVDGVRNQTYYYRHSRIRQGHTNQGQVLGAAIGPGSGSQFLGIDGYFREGLLGFFIQRVEVNDFFHFEYYDIQRLGTRQKDTFNHRINLNLGLRARYKSGPLLLGARFVWNKNYNYGRFNYDKSRPDIDYRPSTADDMVNMQLQFSARYFFGWEEF